MRMLRQQLLLAVLTGAMVFVGTLPVYSQKKSDDPDQIGHRKVARQSIISPQKEDAIGKQYAAAFEHAVEIIQDPDVQRYVTTLAEIIVRNSDWKGPVRIKVVKSPAVNSISLPSGFIYLSSGLLYSAEDEDEVAGAIAHQVAHAAARHWAAGLTHATILQLGMRPMALALYPGFSPIYPPISMACSGFLPYRYPPQTRPSRLVDEEYLYDRPLGYLKLVRRDELEADYLGLQYMYKAGYDPSEFVALLRKLALQPADSQKLPDSLQDEPPFPERIAKAEEEIRTILPDLRSPANPSPEFTLMKTRL